MSSSGSGGVPRGPCPPPPSPVEITHKKDGHQRRPHRFHVSCPLPHPAAGSDADVLFMGPLIPLFRTSGDVSSGFQSQTGQPYSHLVEVYVLHVPRNSPMVQHLLTSWLSAWQPSNLFHIPVSRHRWGSKLGFTMPTNWAIRAYIPDKICC